MSSERLSRRSVLAALGAATAVGGAGCQTAQVTGSDGESTPSQGASEQVGDPNVYSDVYQQVSDAVASIQVYDDTRRGAQGSGFIIDDQHILTNEHVVGAGERYFVRFADTDWRSVSLVGSDVYSDLAVLSTDNPPGSATPLSFAEETPAVGTRVVAIGNPFGLSGSVSEGIVSGINRTLRSANNFSIAAGIQTNAAVNPGNSGGPLVNLDGTAVGIINSGGGDNVGFAISAELADRVVPALVQTGNYDHPYMGIALQSVDPLIAEANDLADASGVYVDDTLDGGPAEGALQGSDSTTRISGSEVPVGGDVIRQLDGTPIPTRQDLASYLALETSPGDVMAVTVERDGAAEVVELTVGSRPEP